MLKSKTYLLNIMSKFLFLPIINGCWGFDLKFLVEIFYFKAKYN